MLPRLRSLSSKQSEITVFHRGIRCSCNFESQKKSILYRKLKIQTLMVCKSGTFLGTVVPRWEALFSLSFRVLSCRGSFWFSIEHHASIFLWHRRDTRVFNISRFFFYFLYFAWTQKTHENFIGLTWFYGCFTKKI